MFKTYLKYHPSGIQFFVFLTLVFTLTTLLQMGLPVIASYFMEAKPENALAFWSTTIYENKTLLFWANGLNALFTFLLPAWVFAYLAHHSASQYLGLNKVKNLPQVGGAVLLAIGILFVIGILGAWIKLLDLGEWAKSLDEQRNNVIGQYLKSANWKELMTALAFIALIPAFAEEFFFRGIFMRFIYSWLPNPKLAIAITAATFALFHFSVYEFIPIFLAGFVLGWVYFITGNLYLSILLHFINNGLQVVIMYISNRMPQLEQLDTQVSIQLIVFIIAALFCLWGVRILISHSSRLPLSWNVRETDYSEDKN